MQRFSYLNSIWLEEEHDKGVVNKIVESYETSYIVARLLYLVPNLKFEDVPNFLSPKIKNLMPNPNHLKDMQKATERLHSAIVEKEKITIFGDYDVDGATSSAIIHSYLKAINVESDIYIPDRILEGYGPNVEAMLKIANLGTKLIITVDCGTVAFEPLEEAHRAGMDAIVIDHHVGAAEIPKSVAVINPNRLDEETHLKYLCGAGVSFFMVVALNAYLRKEGFFQTNGIKEPNIMELLPLVAMGTVCDVMPLEGLNRAFVASGLQVLQNWQNVGMRALKEVAGVTELDAQTFGFTFGPCINAGGRIGDACLGAKLLTETNYQNALKIAQQLHALNIERREIEKQMKEAALEELAQVDFTNANFIFIGSKNYHQGVIGILASRLKDKYNKPVFVYSELETTIKASGRSVIGVDIGGIINSAVKEGLLMAGGGHAMAGGFTCEISKIDALKEFISKQIEKVAKNLSKFKLQCYACQVSLEDVNIGLYKEIEKLAPFGQGNMRPLFVIKNAELGFWKQRGDRHLFMVLVNSFGNSVKGIFFNFFESLSHKALYELELKKFDVLCEITLNKWNGSENVELNIKDIRESNFV